jgi:hypothetical protein
MQRYYLLFVACFINKSSQKKLKFDYICTDFE